MCRSWTWNVTLASLACGLIIDTLLMVNNYRDRDQDAKSGKKTIVVRWGANAGQQLYLSLIHISRTCKVGGKNTASPPGEDDFSTTPGGLDLACTNRTRVTFACELRGFGYGMAVMSAVYVS